MRFVTFVGNGSFQAISANELIRLLLVAKCYSSSFPSSIFSSGSSASNAEPNLLLNYATLATLYSGRLSEELGTFVNFF